MNQLCPLSRRLLAPACLFFILPLACALVNYAFVQVFSGAVLCAVYYACTLLTLWCYRGYGIKPHAGMAFLGVFLYLYGMICLFSQEESLIYNCIFSMPFLALSCFAFQIEEPRFKRMLIWFSALMFAITMALTIPTLLTYPDASRVLASHAFTEYGYETYRRTGAGGFDFIFSLVVLLPCAVAVLRTTKGWARWAAGALALGAIATVFLSGYTTAILLMAAAIALTVCTLNKYVWRATLIAVPVTVLLLLIFRQEAADLLRRFASLFSAFAVRSHLNELADILAQEAQLGGLQRMQLYGKSIDAFLAYPLFGAYIRAGTAAVSGHSTLLDLLGGGGLACIIPYAGYLFCTFLQVDRRLADVRLKNAWRVSTALYILLQLVNPIFASYLIIFSYTTFAAVVLMACDRTEAA